MPNRAMGKDGRMDGKGRKNGIYWKDGKLNRFNSEWYNISIPQFGNFHGIELVRQGCKPLRKAKHHSVQLSILDILHGKLKIGNDN
jgi:hypothetical protein